MTVIDAESKLKVERTHLAQQVKERDEKLTQALLECERSVSRSGITILLLYRLQKT